MNTRTFTNTIAAAATAVVLAATTSASAENWIYTGGTITNSVWTLGVSGDRSSLTVSGCDRTLNAGTGGILDLSAPVVDTAGNACAITAIDDWVFNNWSVLVKVVLPDTLVSIGYKAFGFDSPDGCNLKDVRCASPIRRRRRSSSRCASPASAPATR